MRPPGLEPGLETGLGGLPGLPPPPPPGGSIESLDNKHDKLITEYDEYVERSKNTDKVLNEDRLISGVDALLNENEFDGLACPSSNGTIDLLVDWGVESETRQEAMDETKRLINENGVITGEVSIGDDDSTMYLKSDKSPQEVIAERMDN